LFRLSDIYINSANLLIGKGTFFVISQIQTHLVFFNTLKHVNQKLKIKRMKIKTSNILSFFIASLLFVSTTTAQNTPAPTPAADTSYWTKGGLVSFNFSQVALSNWAGGGQSSVALNGFLNVFAKYKKGIHSWDNTLDLGYGIFQQGDAAFRKSDDKIDFTSKYGRQASKVWYYSALVNFKSQFAPGYNYPDDSTKISNLLAPAYVLASIGMDYKPNKSFSLYISPATGKFTIVNDRTLSDAGAFGVEGAEYDTAGVKIKNSKQFRAEIGGYIKAQFNKDIMENINFQTKLELFSNYIDNPQNIDVNWETILSMKVNKFITANVSATLVYDDDIDIAIDSNDDGIVDKSGPRTQFKEVLSVGLSYKF
jgi:hypothetical protein